MIPLTIQILIHNNEQTIEKTLKSILELNGNIIIGDLGCIDKTVAICEKYKCKIYSISLNNDLSQARNFLNSKSSSLWNLYLNANEILLFGLNDIEPLLQKEPNIYKIGTISGDVISYSNRLWHKKTNAIFEKPVFEYLSGTGKFSGLYLNSVSVRDNIQYFLVDKWLEKNPLLLEPLYYKSLLCLQDKQFDAFINYADLYFLQNKESSMSFVMASYYYSMVQLLIKKNHKVAYQYLLPCLANRPQMAEFWCLFGDIYYDLKRYENALELYENAMICGTQRLKEDDYPMEISKYKEYPKKMIEVCKKLIQSSSYYMPNSSHQK
jgi:tetratricopeptide (TPR) repeat protein